jgi:hypothetical protein
MLKRVTMHLARCRDFPAGSHNHGYDMIAPLDEAGRLDDEAWKEERTGCRVRRFWNGEPESIGLLVHRRGGAGGATWTIDYDPVSTDDDESVTVSIRTCSRLANTSPSATSTA